MSPLQETRHAGSFILSTANGYRSFENVTIAAGENLPAGAVLGKVTATGHYVAYDNQATDGSAAAAAILLHPVDASGGAQPAAVVVRDAEVNENELDWDDEGTTAIAAGIADLKAVGIIVR